MDIVFDDQQLAHDPKRFLVRGEPRPNPEQPARAERLLSSALAAGHRRVVAENHGEGPLAALHTPEYLAFLETIHQRWLAMPDASDEVIANVHPPHRQVNYPASPVGQAGYHMADTACPITAETWAAARASANSAVDAAHRLLAGEPCIYALCRPPGHHAFADCAGGFCFLNNTAVAAGVLRERYSRVAVLDVDVHHGNGTQGIFYRRDDVLTISLHADPLQFYPFFWGYASERGDAQGLGYNLNVPLPIGSGDDAYLAALQPVLQHLSAFRPGALVVALGLDAYQGDPLAGLAITTPGFARIGTAIASLGLPTLLVQEGGYLCDALGDNLVSFLSAFDHH